MPSECYRTDALTDFNKFHYQRPFQCIVHYPVIHVYRSSSFPSEPSTHTARRSEPHSRPSLFGGESFRNIDEFDDARNPSGLHDEGRGLLAEGPSESSRSVFSRDDAGQEESTLSSFNETLFNACNLLIGCGLLSLPYAMRLAGWFGAAVLLLFSALTCYTAKILGRIQEYVPAKKLRDGPGAYTIYGFHDMGELVFGEYGKLFISVCLDRPVAAPHAPCLGLPLTLAPVA